MIVLEALAHDLAIVTTDVYALREMVRDGVNGVLLEPPLSVWAGYLPSPQHYQLARIHDVIRRTDTAAFETRLVDAMVHFAQNPAWRFAARRASRELYDRQFSRHASSIQASQGLFTAPAR